MEKIRQKEQTTLKHKILSVIGTILCVILIPILAINVTLIAKSYINSEKVPSIGGILPLIVLTDSMYPEIHSGDLIICHTEDAENVKEGDIISIRGMGRISYGGIQSETRKGRYFVTVYKYVG